MIRLFVLFIFVLCLRGNSLVAQKSAAFHWKIHSGMVFPTGWGRKSNEISFKDVAKPGVALLSGVVYQPQNRLSLGIEVGYQYLADRTAFWNVSSRGRFDANYHAFSLRTEGLIYFSDRAWQPYSGMHVGGYCLRNTLLFDSFLNQTPLDESVSYTTTNWKPGFGFIAGMSYRVSARVRIGLQIDFTIIPRLESQLEPILEQGVVVDYVLKNPHEKQHQMMATLVVWNQWGRH